jgi:hypothetical protein
VILTSIVGLVSGGAAESASAEEFRDASINFHVADGIRLGSPSRLSGDYLHVDLEPLSEADDKAAGLRLWYRGDPAMARAEASWPILQGQAETRTGYTVTTVLDAKGSAVEGSCTISGPSGPAPFHCVMGREDPDWAWNWDLQIIDDRVERVAEASGSITAKGVSLVGGEFTTESELRIDGAEVIPEGMSTQFDAVLTPQDVARGPKTPEPNGARISFLYLIRDADGSGKSAGEQLYIRGSVSNHEGQWRQRYVGGASCEIVDDHGRVIKDPPYWCDQAGSYASSDHYHYNTHFMVSPRR